MLVAEVAGCSKKAPEPITEFTPEVWDTYPDLRHYMVEDMEAKIDILNLTPDEILDILGTNEVKIIPYGEGERGAIIYRITEIGRHVGTLEIYYILISENGDVERTSTKIESGW